MHLEHIVGPLDDDIHSIYSQLDAFGQYCLHSPSSGPDFATSAVRYFDFSLVLLLKSQSKSVKSQSNHHRSRDEVERDDVDEAAAAVAHVEPKMMVEAIAAKPAPHLRFGLHQTLGSRQSARRQSAAA